MLTIRSWPVLEPQGRAHVVDRLPRFLIHDYDYKDLARLHDDILLLEWDIAVDSEMMDRFKEMAALTLGQVMVAPYRLYDNQEKPVWAHRHVNKETGFTDWIEPRETDADYFSFGMIYLPINRVREFMDAPKATRGVPAGMPAEHFHDERLTDNTFSAWYHRMGYGPAYVCWDVMPVHLHY